MPTEDILRIYMGNRYSRIENVLALKSGLKGYNLNNFYKIISSFLSVKVPGYFFSKKYKSGIWNGEKRFYNLTNDTFPTGLLGTVLHVLKGAKIPYTVIDKRSPELKVKPLELKGVELRDYQIDALQRMIKLRFGIVHHPTGAGKTYLIVALFNMFRDYKCLYLTHRLDLILQTKKRLIDSGINPDDIGIIGGGNRDIKKITLATCQSLWALRNTDTFEELSTMTDALCVDEIHIIPAETYYKIAMKIDAGYRFGFSGTPLTDNDYRNMHVRAATGPVLTKVSADLLIARELLVQPSIFFISSEAEPYECLAEETYNEIYESSIVTNEWRNDTIATVVRKAEEQNLSTLVLVKRVAHGEILSELLNAPFVYGQDKTDRREEVIQQLEHKEIKTLISSVIFDEGVDIKNIDVLIVAAGGNSYAKIIQRIGRGMRKKADKYRLIVVDFDDTHNKYTKRHSSKRLSVCRDTYGGDVQTATTEEVLSEIENLGKFNKEFNSNKES